MRRSGDLPGANELMGSVLERSTQGQGVRHPNTLLVQADYATFIREHGDLEQARELAVSVATGYRDLVGPAHPFAVGTAGNVGLALWEYGERDEALRIAERALAGMRQAVGDDHPWTLGRAKPAMGETHPLTLSCKAALSDDLRSLRRGQEAAKLEQETLQQLSDTLGPQHPHTMSVRRRERPYWDFEPQPT
jgi:hypothetical protein